MICVHCGKKIIEGRAFCGGCGNPVIKTDASAAKKHKTLAIAALTIFLSLGVGTGVFFAWQFLFAMDNDEPIIETIEEEHYIAEIDHDYGRRAAEEFLAAYRSLFIETIWDWPITVYGGLILVDWDRPEADHTPGLFNAITGEQISGLPDDMPFLRRVAGDGRNIIESGFRVIASDFTLHDLNNDGIPEISISFTPIYVNGPFTFSEFFVYVNGVYRRVGEFVNLQFYSDAMGRQFLRHLEDLNYNRLYHMRIDAHGLSLDVIAEEEITWINENGYFGDIFAVPQINNQPLVPIQPLSDMQNNITVTLTHRLRAEAQQITITDPVNIAESPAAAAYLILPFSDTRLLTERDLQGLNANDLRLARNEIYARHGRQFRDDELQAHFNAMPWYSPILPHGVEPVLSDLERSNVLLIQEFERRLGQ